MAEPAVELTERELAVLRGIVRGDTYRQIASYIGVGYEMIRTNSAAIRKKLGVKSRSAAAAWAVRNGRCD